MTNTFTITTLLNFSFKSLGSIAVALLILLFMITIHEFGHYIVAKIFDFRVNEFAIGMGPAIYKKKRKNGEYFSIRLFPLGGYCAFEGEDDDNNDPRAFNNKKPWQRILVLVAGATMNFLAAILVFCISITAYGQMCVQAFEVRNPGSELSFQNEDIILSLNNKDIYLSTDLISALKGKKEGDTVPAVVLRNGEKTEISIKLKADPVSKSLQDMNGILKSLDIAPLSGVSGGRNEDPSKLIKGDAILRVSTKKPDLLESASENLTDCYIVENGELKLYYIDKEDYLSEKRAFTLDDLTAYISTLTNEDTLYMYISRNGERVMLSYNLHSFADIDKATNENVCYFLGNVTIETAGYRMYSQSVKFSFFEGIGRGFIYAFKNVWSTLVAFGQLITGRLGLDAIGGPVTTISLTSQMVSMGFRYVLEITGFIGVSLAVFNLLPIPALDGARAIFVLIEWIRKKPINRKVEGMIHSIGLVALLLFAIVIDLVKCI